MNRQPIHHHEITVPESVVDANGHVNNVAYVQWMQDAAVSHATASGCAETTRALGATWVARRHLIEYLAPAFAGERVLVQTWVANLRRVRSLRRYQFNRQSDGVLLARGETDWVLVDALNGRPRAIPDSIRGLFDVVSDRPGSAADAVE